VQGKALTALATLLAAVALVACGDDDAAETSGGEGTSRSAGLAQAQERAGQIKKQRQGESSHQDAGAGQEKGNGPGSQGSKPTPSPTGGHSDSGGGAAQFQRKGSDNSIQEFGEEGAGSARGSAAAVLHAYLDARAARRWEQACSYLSAEVIASLEQFAATYAGDREIEGCADVLEALSASTATSTLRESAEADVGSLRLQGDRGFLLYHGPGGLGYAFPVVQEGGEWKLAAPDATPLP
jgi:hypothetical protein